MRLRPFIQNFKALPSLYHFRTESLLHKECALKCCMAPRLSLVCWILQWAVMLRNAARIYRDILVSHILVLFCGISTWEVNRVQKDSVSIQWWVSRYHLYTWFWLVGSVCLSSWKVVSAYFVRKFVLDVFSGIFPRVVLTWSWGRNGLEIFMVSAATSS